MTLFGIPYDRRQVLYLLGDVVLALFAIWFAHFMRFGGDGGLTELLGIYRASTVATSIFIATNITLLYIVDAYSARIDFREPVQSLRLFAAVVAAFVAQMALFYALPDWGWGRGVAALASMSFTGGLLVWRVAVSILKPVPARRMNTLVLGAGTTGREIVHVIQDHPEQSRIYRLVGYLDDADELPTLSLPLLGGTDRLLQEVKQRRIGSIIVAIPAGMKPELTKALLDCKTAGVRIEDSRSVYKRVTGKVPIFHVSDTSLIFGPDFAGSSRWMSMTQRAADIGISLVGLTLSAPIIFVAGMLIRLETPGPAIFKQERLGANEQPFTIYKLRTMGVDAEAKTGAVWSQGAGDPRVTRIGTFLRRSRIDELPQFYNVLIGDMSMVGPRPERQHFVDQLKQKIPFYGLRFAVKPGVTGWAQVMYRYGASEEDAAEKLRYDLFAVQELSPMLYALIILKTVQTVVMRPGS